MTVGYAKDIECDIPPPTTEPPLIIAQAFIHGDRRHYRVDLTKRPIGQIITTDRRVSIISTFNQTTGESGFLPAGESSILPADLPHIHQQELSSTFSEGFDRTPFDRIKKQRTTVPSHDADTSIFQHGGNPNHPLYPEGAKLAPQASKLK